MLYATDGVNSEEDLKKPMIGIGSVWYAFVSRVWSEI